MHYYHLLFSLLFFYVSCPQIAIQQSSVIVAPVDSVKVDLESSLHTCDSKFLSITIDSDLIKYKFSGFDYGSEKLQNLAKALSPCDFRLGGTYADFLTFDPDGKESSYEYKNVQEALPDKIYDAIVEARHFDDLKEMKKMDNFTMKGHLWDQMMKFFTQAGWDVMFDFNLFRWKNGLWDPTNAEKLLKYSALRGYEIPAFQLGNEPNSFLYNFNFSIPAATLVKDFQILKDVLKKYPQYSSSKLYGPDVTNLNRHSSSRKYLQDFVTAGGNQLVDEISLHHYYLNGRLAKVKDFYDVSVMDTLKDEIETGYTLGGGSHIRLTETSSCYGGGAPGLSDGYVAGFLWLDKLGLAAKYGVTRVFRQTFYGGSYALLSPKLDPNPDYFLSLLHKQLIEGHVFNATVQPNTRSLRIYAHCTRDFGLYKKGAITLAYLNTKNESSPISLSQFSKSYFDLYILTPGDSDGLKSRFVKLNGEVLKMSGSSLPPLNSKPHKGDIVLPPLSFGFIVIPEANVSLCKK